MNLVRADQGMHQQSRHRYVSWINDINTDDAWGPWDPQMRQHLSPLLQVAASNNRY